MNAQQIADGFQNHDDADCHDEHVAVEVREGDDADGENQRHDGGNQHEIPAVKAIAFQRKRTLNAADAADDDHQTEYDEQHARQKARTDERENAERRCADANQQLKRVGCHAAGENKGKNVEHTVNGDACADR